MIQTCLNCRHFGGMKGDEYYCSRHNQLYFSDATCTGWQPTKPAPEPCTPAEPERTTEGSRPAGYITVEVSASIMIPYNEAGAIQLQKDGREQSERNFEAAIIEQLERDSLGVSVTTCICSIVHPENLFNDAEPEQSKNCYTCRYKDNVAYQAPCGYCEDFEEWKPAEEATT